MESIYASVDLGGTNIKVALGRSDGTVLAESKCPTESHLGAEHVLANMAHLIRTMASDYSTPPLAVGLGLPGLVDAELGISRFLPNMPTHWVDVPVKELLEAQLRIPVHVLNDARMATLGELTYGHGRNVSSMIFFGLGTGVGGGVVIDNKLRLGPIGAAGEIGHMTIRPDGPLCGCGNRGCLETLVSGPALAAEGMRLLLSGQAPKLREITGNNTAKVNAATMGEAARAGDQSVVAAIARMAEFLAVATSNLIVAIHPEMVVIGGGVADLDDLLLDPLKEAIRARVRIFPPEKVAVEKCKLGSRAGMLGGLALACRGGA